ncbi:adenylate kinase family protein [Patescibacteria group bacterium]
MNILVMGPQGSGKGTQAKRLARKLDLAYFEAGDILREKAKEKTKLGKKIFRTIHQKGELVSDQIMEGIIKEWLSQKKPSQGFLFDGFPRNQPQYQFVEKILAEKKMKIDVAICLKITRETAIKRLSARRICSECDREYNLVTLPPKNDQLCDQCQIELKQRHDDSPKVIKKRLQIYDQLTSPLVDLFRQQGILEEVDGERPVEVIFQDILGRLGQVESVAK